MRKYGVGLLLLASCSNEPTMPLPDAGRQLVSRCPPPGEPLQIIPIIKSIAAEPCIDYTHSDDAGVAIAHCQDNMLAQGPIGGTLEPITPQGREPRLNPEGDELVTKTIVDTIGDPRHPRYRTTWQRYGRDTNGNFLGPVDVVAPPTELTENAFRYQFSTPSRRSLARVLFLDMTLGVIGELEGGTGGTTIGSYTQQDLGLASTVDHVQLSPDGLRIVLHTMYDGVYFSDRASTADRFRTATHLDAVPLYVRTPFLTEDCARLYYSGYGVVLYQEVP